MAHSGGLLPAGIADEAGGFVLPATPAEAEAARARLGAGAAFIAGGTALQLAWGEGARAPLPLVAVAGLAALQGIARLATPDGPVLRIGAATRLEALRRDALVRDEAPLLARACASLGATGVRHLATLGGNVGWRQGDTLAVLLALDAEAELADGGCLPLAEVLARPVLPLIVALRVAARRAGEWAVFEKVGLRADFSPSRLAFCAIGDGRGGWRVAATAAGLPARRLARVEARLARAGADVETVARAGEGLRAALLDAARADLDGDAARARLAVRLLLGHLGRAVTADAARPATTGDGDPVGAGPEDRNAGNPAAARAHGGTEAGTGTSFAVPHQLVRHADLLARSRPRPDAEAKLAGRAGYLSDRLTPGALHGAILGSPHPHARIVAIDTSAARALPGVHAVVTAADVPGPLRYGLRHVDRPALCDDKVRCIGDPVTAVAADTPDIARAALALIRVEYAPLPVVDDAAAALAADAPAVHDGGNLLHAAHHARGDLAAAEAACAFVIDEVYDTPRQMHAYLETEGGIAEPDGAGGLALYFGCQNPERDRQVIAAMLGLDPARVRAVGSPVGGSYGGKDELTVQPIAALLAWKSGRAVRLRWSRAESTDLGVKRHPMRIRMRSGCDAAGRLRLHRVDILADTGAYATHGPEVLDAAAEHAVGPYAWDAVGIDARLAYTNNGIAGAFRGFGAVQTQFALECQIDRLAGAAGVDPVEFRRRNLLPADAPGPLGQVVAPFDGPARVLDVIARHPLAAGLARPSGEVSGGRAWSTGMPVTVPASRWRRGVGLALVHRSDAFGRGGPGRARLALALAGDGRIELRATLVEMGQNLLDVVIAEVARGVGCAPSDVRPVLGDTALGPDSGAASASRSTTMVRRAVELAAPGFVARLRALAVEAGAVDAGSLRGAAVEGGQVEGGQIEGGQVEGGALAPDAAALPRPGAGGLVDACGRHVIGYADLARVAAPGALPVCEVVVEEELTPTDLPGAHYLFGASAALAEVEVDSWTGAVAVRRIVMTAALGPVVSAQGLLGQMEGGAVMGQGLATVERLPMRAGRYLARNLDGYLVPGFADAPDCELIAVENLMPGDDHGPRGAGEIGVNIAVPAIANAVRAAIGLDITRLPIEPDAVLDHLDTQP
ncbi:molybdopterin cofactor-binding domain-containing protein [Derxia gummosa]|uniref:Molybdopterin cofactor-binding domain-containing protein n=1 Tax=Derxia gummosa DSM 723 TaxID=1121388 RepID=A0A8B6XAR4_9BURK|nr:molybdopterin cofactor-binding domain-containing protein [Derxia gummosa]